jgi:DNA repair protein RecO (recombination protein O)
MTVSLQAAYVLHRRPFSDSSLLVELFSLGQGRQPVVARGARKASKRGRPPLQPFLPIWAAWRGRGEVATLTDAEPRAVPLELAGERLFCGMYLNELVMKLTPRGEPLEGLFHLYEHTLGRLGRDGAVAPVLRTFELAMLEELGYGMLLTHSADDHQVSPDAWYEYAPEQGPRPVANPGPAAVRGATLLAMAERNFSDPEVRRQALRLMRRTIDHHLDHRVLKSRELFVRRRHRSSEIQP